jgi:hypothetical protein
LHKVLRVLQAFPQARICLLHYVGDHSEFLNYMVKKWMSLWFLRNFLIHPLEWYVYRFKKVALQLGKENKADHTYSWIWTSYYFFLVLKYYCLVPSYYTCSPLFVHKYFLIFHDYWHMSSTYMVGPLRK